MVKRHLPANLTAWSQAIKTALSLPTSALRVPPQLMVLDSNHKPVWYDEWMPTTKSSSATVKDVRPPPTFSRNSGVLVALMPLPMPNDECLFVDRSMNRIDRKGQPTGKSNRDNNINDPISFEGMDLCFPVTLRQSTMRAHRGQISFPGGRCDAGESAEQAAMREAQEEIGLPPFAYEVLGHLTQTYSYPSQTYVNPVVSLSKEFARGMHTASEEEVESLHILRLSDLLLDPEGHHHRFHQKWSSGAMHMPAFYTCDGKMVWGLTCFVITELIVRLATALGLQEVTFTKGLGASMGASSLEWHNPYDPRDAKESTPNSKL